MNLIKLGKKGQVSIPQGILRELAIAPDAPLLVETTPDGAILLRQVSVHPVEMYSAERLAEFERENALTPAHARRFAPQLGDFDAWLKVQAGAPRQAVSRAAEPTAPYRVTPARPTPAKKVTRGAKR